MPALPQSAKKHFRPDINGLRAWAVMAVVLYHFGVPGLNGGFIGVDVFFVISGYLMTGIILRGLEKSDFSIWQFYLARGRRIYPALAVTCVAVLIVGAFFLMPKEYETLGRHARESLQFTSNLRYLKESGYFDVASQDKWLLHTWSLSVEWQFYLVLPLFMMLLWRFFPSRRAITTGLSIVLLASLAYSVWQVNHDSTKAFFLLKSRAWEMLAGGMVYLLTPYLNLSALQTRVAELVGFALILASLFFLDPYKPWPGLLAIPSVLGAVLVLIAQRESSLWTRAPVAQWLGTRSYSIYLWHWPLMVLLSMFGWLPDPLWIVIGLLGSLLLGHLSYQWVEVPSQRKLSQYTPKKAAIILISVAVVLILVSQQIRRTGVPQRLPEGIARIAEERKNDNPRLEECLNPDNPCLYGEEPVKAILLGDSHADAIVTALQVALPEGPGGIHFQGASACMVLFDAQHSSRKGKTCIAMGERLQNEHSTLYPGVPIVMMQRASDYVNGGQISPRTPLYNMATNPVNEYNEEYFRRFQTMFVNTVCTLSENHPLYLVRPIPEMPVDVPTRYGRGVLMGNKQEPSITLEQYHQRHAYIWQAQDAAVAQCGVKILNPLPYLCDEQICHSVHNGIPMYRDADHLSESGNKLLIPMLSEVFEKPAE